MITKHISFWYSLIIFFSDTYVAVVVRTDVVVLGVKLACAASIAALGILAVAVVIDDVVVGIDVAVFKTIFKVSFFEKKIINLFLSK